MPDAKELLQGADALADEEWKKKLQRVKDAGETERSENMKVFAHRVVIALLVAVTAVVLSVGGRLLWLNRSNDQWLQVTLIFIFSNLATALGSINGWPWLKEMMSKKMSDA